MTIGETIRKYRLAAELSQTALAEKIGVTQKDISRWENGTRKPKIDALQKIADACNADIVAFLPERTIKINRAIKQSDIFKGDTVVSAILEQLPQEIITECPSRLVAKVMEAINKAYHLGRASTGAEMIDTNCVWIDSVGKLIEWDEVGAEYEQRTVTEPASSDCPQMVEITRSVKIKDGKLIPKFVDKN